MHPIDRKITSILKYGKKKQIEIVELLDYEASGKTVRRRLDKLDTAGKIAREGESGRFYLPEQEREPIRPKPFADQDEINRILFNIEKEFDEVSSAIDDFYDNGDTSERILRWLGDSESRIDITKIRACHRTLHILQSV